MRNFAAECIALGLLHQSARLVWLAIKIGG
jgi:hypothetical protein